MNNPTDAEKGIALAKKHLSNPNKHCVITPAQRQASMKRFLAIARRLNAPLPAQHH